MEKTFEELMHEYTVKMDGVTTYYLQPKTVLALMKIVRESTIVECERLMIDEDCAIYKLNQLPTDRIILTDK